MSAFLAFRSAAVSVLRPRRAHHFPQTTSSFFKQYSTKHELIQAAKQRKKVKELEMEERKKNKPRPATKPKVFAKHPKNNDIPHAFVQVIGADGQLDSTPRPLIRLLDSVNHETHVVRLVTHEPPLVRVLTHLEDKMNQLATKAEKKAAKGQKGMDTTVIQLTWHTADADYEHKISKAKEELEKGSMRVEILFKNKPRVRYPSKEEMQEEMDQVAHALSEVGQEWRTREIQRGVAKVFIQSRTQKAVKILPTKEEIEAQAKEALTKRLEGQKRSQNSHGSW
ncbi:hypothetical protein BDN70DRAFT_171335 [Pholiota conissans]|uniref:Translation initiation factor 3 N-terminal domain-containing protein n=1 Tax=Pholiota conissans TaxID=109636 RepID=A0A9P5YXQ0_9AGAR|nr:hypothetical protein BDN70DRAFT_171335 [Pholiota conissans]